ncbi:serine endoprotease [Gemmata obscuriglobus]|uniref:Serine protease n=1 Tax=Gemmata obscuriglobus TaxID=114 RepID=A0A2Z3GX37_9BACT|nr:PDZ domain-containing protein [Gemmata obscuriglobus]AWM37948.1 serine protease [Gemmata obscuriglobus]QEG29194.1 serine endoprotease [Gemmata obscuriglobus]VTS07963.1 trypsin-like serine protease with c-terminal pdz domain : Trypsin-like serine protease with C-terminal PDZ domain OS=Singulisphaera acidiphila (strain ATCC BAA-1392 / DSM 18658 / VKM B-2454 / MOB10) GN=Sinac_0131 PE=4 SV=1: Asp_protease_2: PDZ_2 [Gemmata obscuriglobus UQM 2246]
MKTAFALSVFAGLVSLAPTARGDEPTKEQPKPDAKPVVVPFELLKSRHMAIQVKINDKGPYRLIFDTGAPTNLVNNKIAKEAGILGKGDKGGLPLFGAAPAPKAIKKLEIGDLKLEGMTTMVMDHPTVAAIADVVGPVEGIVGFPFFARYKMTIDYEKKEMTLTPNGFAPGDTMAGMMDKLMRVSGGKKPEPAVLAPAAVWGFEVGGEADGDAPGVTVTAVLAKSPAALGGLKKGDRLLTLDGRWTDTVRDTFQAAALIKPGKAVALVVKRDGKELKLTVTPAKGL